MNLFYQKVKTFLKAWPFFLLLLPVFFIYSGYNELFGFLSVKFLLVNFLFIVTGTLVVLTISFLLFRNGAKAAIFTFFFCLICLSFGYLHDSLKQLNLSPFLTKFTGILPILVLLFVILLIYLRKRRSSFAELYLFLNLLFVILILSEIPNSVKRYRLDKSVHNLIDFRFNAFNEYNPLQITPDSLKPDIYFLVFDAMASSKSLQENFGKNNYKLDTFLLQHGFYVAADAKANYNWTIHSLSSTFNMDYLPNWIAPVMNDPKAYFWGSASILNNSLFSILKKEGYQTKSYQPVSYANPDWPGVSYFNSLKESHYYYKTLPGRIYRDVFWNYSKIDIGFIKEQQMQIIDVRNNEKKLLFDTTKALIKNSCSQTGHPKFIYGHFMLPHEPYTFDSTGKVKTAEQTIIKHREDDAEAYFNQVVFADKVIQELVAYIQQHNKKNTIIIVEGDHGYRTSEGNKAGYTFQNLNAVYFPDQKYEMLYDSLSPVNTFRIVLNKYFAAGLPLLKDSSTLVTQQKETIRKTEKITKQK
ncbi:MAG: sulfatase-like hydrolase/transferase [Chitinophagaceae bacterium]|nr:sulfatase-like hydrolase/transferase [Chitinophagaceae bacterium]